MMEIDRMSYIFGSFARRRQSQEVNSAKRRSIEPKISHDRSKSTPHTPKKAAPTSPRAKSICNVIVDDAKFKCPMCRRLFVEPRVLPCLHTFCLRCLQELEANDYSNWGGDDSDESANTSGSRKGSGSGGSGYMSDKNNTLHRSCSPTTVKRICCPTCGARAEVPFGGVSCYPPNYLLQHRMVLATLNAQSTHLLCDLCTSDVSATARCMDCAISFCEHCEEVHLRQKAANGHEVLSLEEARRKGITKVRRQIMCVKHPDLELTLFCSTCCQVICPECVPSSHKGHPCESISRAVKAHLTDLRLAAARAKSIAEQSALAANRLHATSKKIETQCSKVQAEIEEFIEKYIKSVEEHRKKLLQQVIQTQTEKLQEIGKCKTMLHKRVREARDVAFFLDELLSEGTDVEVMSFLKPVMSKIDKCGKRDVGKVTDLSLTGSLLFLPEEVVQYSQDCCPLYGVVTTQTVAPSHCVISTEGLSNLRVGKKTDLLLETRDHSDTKLERGGEQVSAEIRYRDAGVSRFLHVDIDDRRDGTYTISFVPDVAGKLVLSISIKGQPIKDSPFPITVRTLKPHHGTFHCCSFCSSGGSKEATCGCEGRMPGGYKGCGHGHEGHPGRRHWSCCGNVLEHSECSKGNHSHYQFTL
ncbi:tripartite motif-containing protein 45 isoform X1 [Tribolium madens]|uniref:tripartite motif-containing protein 45 isoform X1 n=2 Tax=Tribolium madens TaxID=41895 RepID=UPI001CF72940|nr:tripartite motif-containing protein 45 isoform X1 [Tribolium madens]XP_044266935.1 tripartite motif-containing protein 45 isoform X1 [Tribolium madens]XP_044266936.1 tripartite motif-containing protein 45 isoform X1 [Tribolium madens]XP_044266938.1 tripartite motif-containing protein 45 isoform X1 [Tribolium madens]